MFDFLPIPYRIRIGVTGHRTLDDPATLEATVRRALATQIDGLFPRISRRDIERVRSAGTTAISFRVLSPLAEGADRVVARAILSEPDARLDVVLPLTVDDYLEDFPSQQSRTEFAELLATCRKPVSLRHRRIDQDCSDPETQIEMRREAYKKAGQYVVDHCDVLIAVWDGQPSQGRGGTADTIRYAREQRRPVIRVWGGEFELLDADNNGLDATALDAIDTFNQQTIPPEQVAAARKVFDHQYFEKPQAATIIPPSVRELVNDRLFPYYYRASILAEQSQRRYYRAGKYIYGLSAAAVGCAAVGVLFVPWLGFGIELLLLILMIFTLRRARSTHAHQRWIESRFLAERIRCGTFMAICGMEPRPIEVLPYMGHSQTVNDWMVRVFDEVWDRLPALNGCTSEHCLPLNAYVREVWIGEQVKFHQDKKAREGRARHRLAQAGEIVLPVTIAAAAAHLLMLLWQPVETAPESIHLLHEGLHRGLAFVALLFPAIAASLAGIEAHREHLRLEKRSANMAPQLQRVSRQIASATDPERFEELLQQADEMMLRETQDWLMLMRYIEIKAS